MTTTKRRAKKRTAKKHATKKTTAPKRTKRRKVTKRKRAVTLTSAKPKKRATKKRATKKRATKKRATTSAPRAPAKRRRKPKAATAAGFGRRLRVGDFAKIRFESSEGPGPGGLMGERMWLQVIEVAPTHYVGKLDSKPMFLGASVGDRFAFQEPQILQRLRVGKEWVTPPRNA
jgi:hypothetical protein